MHKNVKRTAAVAAVVLLSAGARAQADDAYPTQLVMRPPYLPQGMSEVRFSLDAIRFDNDPDRAIDSVALELGGRRRVGPVEAFVRAVLMLERPEYSTNDRFRAIDAGVRVPVTCLSDVQVTLTSEQPTMRSTTWYELGASYEGRFWISPTIGISGAIGATVGHWETFMPPATPFDPIRHDTSNYERGLALLQLDLQTSDNVAVSIGAQLRAQHDEAAAPADTVTTDLHYHAQIFYAAPRFDVVTRAMIRHESFGTELTMTLGFAARF